MTKKNRASQLLMLGFMLPLAAQVSLGQQRAIPSVTGQSVPGQSGQSISEQKKAVVFIFGTIHPLNPDNSAMRDIQGNRVAVNVPLGTGFFVGYPDRRLGAGYNFCYLVTAKHVLQDVDGTFLASVTVRLNLKSPTGDSEVGFIRDIPVTDAQGNLLWFHSEDPAEDVVALPLFPAEHAFEFTTISTRMFRAMQALHSCAVAEGDELDFSRLMEQ